MLDPLLYKKAIDAIADLGSNAELHTASGSIRTLAIFDQQSIYIPKHFKMRESCPPEIISLLGEHAWIVMDNRIVWTADAMRDYWGTAVYININTLNYRGFRPPNSPSWTATSQHAFGRAIDFNVKGMPDKDVQKEICDQVHKQAAFRFITRMEEGTVGWTHVDCANTGKENLVVFKP